MKLCLQKIIHPYVIKFVSRLKNGIFKRREDNENLSDHARARIMLVKYDQNLHFPDVCSALNNPNCRIKNLPNIVKQLGVYLDSHGLMRVRGKFKCNSGNFECPVLLSRNSELANLIIRELHRDLGHAGKYVVLAELRKKFYMPSMFSKVRSILRECVVCKRFNGRPINLNQSPYRDERISPSEIPFRNVYVDHFGFYNCKFEGTKKKVYLLLITCMFTRAFSLQICLDMSVNSYLRAMQMHIHRYGVPSKVYSDSGTTLVAGGNVLLDFWKDVKTKSFLSNYNIDSLEFSQFCKGNSALGSLVESGVKIAKRLIYGTIRNNCLDYHDFELLISDINHLINKRPVAFPNDSKDSCVEILGPRPITPEMLIYGHSLPSLNCIPALQPVPDDLDYVPRPCAALVDSYDKLRKLRSNMIELYRDEFLATLLAQSVDSKDRYVPKVSHVVSVGDVVLIKEGYTKAANYPLAVVLEVFTNDLDEVTSVRIRRGDTGEVVRRHSCTIVPLLSSSEDFVKPVESPAVSNAEISPTPKRDLPRKAAREALARISSYF